MTAGARVLEAQSSHLSSPDSAAPTRKQTRFTDAFGIELQSSMKKYKRAGQKGGGVPRDLPSRQPRDWSDPGQLCVRSRGGRSPAPRAETAPHKALATAHSAPWNPGRAVATATAPPSRSANGRAFCRGAGPAPGARGSPRPAGAGAVTAAGQSALRSPEGPLGGTEPAGRAYKGWNFGNN